MTFSEIGLNKNLQKAIADLGFETPTPIQQESIPYLLENETDLIALAQTGTGKTAAFGLPVLHKIEVDRKLPQAIILAPTRELCLQITKDLGTYAKYTKGLRITAVYGATNIQIQIKALNSGSQIVVGTPGRVIDLIKRKKLNRGLTEENSQLGIISPIGYFKFPIGIFFTQLGIGDLFSDSALPDLYIPNP